MDAKQKMPRKIGAFYFRFSSGLETEMAPVSASAAKLPAETKKDAANHRQRLSFDIFPEKLILNPKILHVKTACALLKRLIFGSGGKAFVKPMLNVRHYHFAVKIVQQIVIIPFVKFQRFIGGTCRVVKKLTAA